MVGSDIDWLRNHLVFADRIIPGLAEDKIERIATGLGGFNSQLWGNEKSPLFNLDHQLVSGFERYQPSIEASRGCGMGCAFCEERDIPLTRLKKPDLFVSHFKDVIEQYGDTSIRPYVQSSFFAPNSKWSEDLAGEVRRAGLKLSWRCETRVDSIKPDSIAALAEAGLKVIDLGLESASAVQILRMQKSKDPDRYLRSASDLLGACKRHGIWVKLNFLIYSGETQATYDETISWLDQHSESVKGISVGPVIVFGSPRASQDFVSSIVKAGGRLVDEESSERTGIAQIHPSSEISNSDSEILSLEASRRYMTDCDYFDLKSFSYYSRDYTRADFDSDIKSCNVSLLPFRLASSAE